MCPKCKSPAVLLVEHWDGAVIYFETDSNGLWDGNDGTIEPPDTPMCITARCSCDYSWKLRDVTQIDELFNRDK
jgi:hypothetical protein